MSEFSDLIQRGFLETRDLLGPAPNLILTGPNGKTARVLSTSFPKSQTLKEASLDAKLPATVSLLTTDATRLAIVDRSIVGILGQKLTVIVIDTDPADPLTTLTLAQFA